MDWRFSGHTTSLDNEESEESPLPPSESYLRMFGDGEGESEHQDLE